MNKTILSYSLKLHTHEASGFQYAVIQDLNTFEKISTQLYELWSHKPLDTKTQDGFRQAFQQGQKLVLISNGSQGMGDLFDLVNRVSQQGTTVILATHLNTLQSDPQPNYPYGDRFIQQMEAVFIPKESNKLVLDLLKAGAGGGTKQRLEVSISEALLPAQ